MFVRLTQFQTLHSHCPGISIFLFQEITHYLTLPYLDLFVLSRFQFGSSQPFLVVFFETNLCFLIAGQRNVLKSRILAKYK